MENSRPAERDSQLFQIYFRLQLLRFIAEPPPNPWSRARIVVAEGQKVSKRKLPVAAPQHGGGPKTPEGKQRSAMNSVRHGLTGKTVVLPNEDPAQFQELVDDYFADFAPVSAIEIDLVHELAVCRWRLQRIWKIETYAFELTLERKRPDVDAEFSGCSTGMRTALAFLSMADESKALSLLLRYETRLTRRFNEILKALQAMQKERAKRDAAPPVKPIQPPCQTNSPGPILVPKPSPPEPNPPDRE